jgi:hypothetical protein
MRKGYLVIAAAAAVAAGGGVAAPAVALAPTATAAPPPPRAGIYAGRTSQGLRFSLRVAPSRRVLTSARFGFRVHCAARHTLQFTISPILRGQPWRLNTGGGTGFRRSLQDTSGERYWIRGHFSGTTLAAGTLWTVWHSPHNGTCRSGRVTWHATLSGR